MSIFVSAEAKVIPAAHSGYPLALVFATQRQGPAVNCAFTLGEGIRVGDRFAPTNHWERKHNLSRGSARNSTFTIIANICKSLNLMFELKRN